MADNRQVVARFTARFAPMLRAAGFRKRGPVFNRRVEDGVVQVIAIQLSDTNHSVDLWGRLPNGDIFDFPARADMTVALGTFIPRMLPDAAIVDPAWTRYASCQIQSSLSDVIGRTDRWWDLREPSQLDECEAALLGPGVAYLRSLDSEAAVLTALDADFSLGWSLTGHRVLQIAQLLMRRGESTLARQQLLHYDLDVAGRPPQAPQTLRELLERNGYLELTKLVG